MDPSEETRLANQLLSAEDPKPIGPPKRNSKDSIRANILKVVDKYELELQYSDTKLKRMNKEQLTRVLAEVMEESVKIDMAKSVGVDPRAGGKVVTLGALRMIHNICATGFEKGFNAFAPDLCDMEVEGFSDSLRHPDVQGTVDECLAEIAAENPEVLEYFDSPYARLALVWVGVLSTTIKKAQQKNVQHMEPRMRQRAPPTRVSRGGGPSERKEHGHNEPRVQVV
jgi:hypothetical protein